MKYTKLIEKISEYQNDKIIPAVRQMEGNPKYDGVMPKLTEQLHAATLWVEENKRKIGEAEVPTSVTNIDPMLALSDTLTHYQDIFDEKTRGHVVEYLEFIQQLFEEVKEADVKPM